MNFLSAYTHLLTASVIPAQAGIQIQDSGKPVFQDVIPAQAGIQSVKLSLATHYKVSLRDAFSLDSCLRRNDEGDAGMMRMNDNERC